MNRIIRALITLVAIIAAMVIFMIYDGTVVPEDPIRVVIFTAMVMLSVVTLWIEHFFTTPTDVIATSISILVLLAPLRQVYQPVGIWYGLLFWYCFSLAILSVLALILLKEDAPKETSRNKASAILKTILVRIGLGRIQYFLLLVLSVLGFYSVQDKFTITVFIYAFVFLLIDPKRLVKATLKLIQLPLARLLVCNQRILSWCTYTMIDLDYVYSIRLSSTIQWTLEEAFIDV